MKRVLLGLAAAAMAASAASAQSLTGGDFRVDPSPRFLGPPVVPPDGRYRGGHRLDRRGQDRFIYGGYGYPGYYYQGDYDANRGFDPDKWNDWWHERPERAFPRWVWQNQNCTEDRMWWSGGGWRCTP
jgi:hypothetical protein